MKQTSILVLTCLALHLPLALAARGVQPPLVLATTSVFADMAEVVGGNLVRVRSIVPRGSDPHTYEATPGDVRLVASADLVLENGLRFEGWLSALIRNAKPGVPTATLTAGITPLGADDPHAWMTAANGMVYARHIRDALTAQWPQYADEFDFNYQYYRRQLEDLEAEIQAQVARIPEGRCILVTSHDAFRYYGAQYGLRVESALGTSTEADVRTTDVMRLHRVIREYGIPALFVEVSINPKLMHQIAEDSGVAIGGQLFSDSLGEMGGPADTYLDMLRHNTTIIVAGLTGQTPTISESQGISPKVQWALMLALAIVLLGSFGLTYHQLDKTV